MQQTNTDTKGASRKFRIPSVAVALLLVIGSFGAGIAVGTARSYTQAATSISITSLFTGEAAQPSTNLSQLWLVWNTLNNKFVPTTASSTRATDQEKVYGMIKGLTDSYGDPYTTFFPPEESKAFAEQVSGNFGGVGMEIGIKNKVIVVVAPLPDSPAEKAGMVTGDKIVAVDGKPTDGFSVEQAVRLIRGEKGTSVKLTVLRGDSVEPITVSIVRATISVPAIKTELRNDSIFIVSLYSFSGLSTNQFREAMRKFVQSGSNKMIIDLRGNPGGFLDAAVDISSYFLPIGYSVVSEDAGSGTNPDVHHSRGYNIFSRGQNLKLVVLIDGGSASASEILAGALHDHGVATLIGKKTFGKGSVQELIDIGGGASLKVTIAKWLTPKGTSISEHGIEPDIEVDRTPEDVEAKKDPQMDKAIEWFRTH